MNIVTAAFLGIVQGLTEFFPVSSSGHLVLVQTLIPTFQQPGVLFDVVLHGGTLFAVLAYFRKKIFKLSINYYLLLVVGTIPAVIIGLLFNSAIENLFTDAVLVGGALLISALFNYLTDKNKPKKEKITFKDSIIIGTFQALAIIPGVSRSGSTIFGGTKLGIPKIKAAEFSFLLSVPAVAGAVVLETYKYGFDLAHGMSFYIVGFIAAFISGYFAISAVLKLLAEKKFKIFAIYCLILGFLAFFI